MFHMKLHFTERFQIVRGILEKYQHNPMTRFWLGPALFIFINDPNLIEKVLNAPECVEKSFLYEFLRLNKGLLAAKRKCNKTLTNATKLHNDFRCRRHLAGTS